MKKLCKRNSKRILSIVLTMVVLLTSIKLDAFVVNAEETESYVTLYLMDNTAEKWIGNDNAVIELVDNSSGHDSYIMKKIDDTTWSVRVPESAYNITFNRYNADKTTQWNSWSAGGRDANNAYYADGSEYGHWEVVKESDEYFHAGDTVYLDISEFTTWATDSASMYINFTDATKEENGGKDINNINREMWVIVIETKIVKWDILKNINSYGLNIKSISDDFDGLTVILENNELELFLIRWADVESYCRSTEEVRFKFIAGEWQQVRKEFPNWSFFKVTNSPYIKWIKEQAGGFMDEDKLIHFMIVSTDYVLDIVSKYEPDECYKK